MAATDSPYRDMVETRVFIHWLRTGVMADAEPLIDLVERKFNPYHDEIGRFTSPPGLTVSYGEGRAAGPAHTARRIPVAGNTAASADSRPRRRPGPGTRTRATGQSRDTGSENGFRSALVRDSVLQSTSNADSYFELNQRQAHLNNLRRRAGRNPDPAVRADLDDFQRRLDYNRTILAERAKTADAEVFKLLRMGNAPVDIGAGLVNIARSQAELNDYLAVAGAIPVAGVAGKVGRVANVAKPGKVVSTGAVQVVQLGGAFRNVRKLRGHDSHHIPADSISPIARGDGPTIAMSRGDHAKTASWGNKPGARPHREAQAKLIQEGKFSEAQKMDIDDIRRKFGDSYDEAIEQMLIYTREKGF